MPRNSEVTRRSYFGPNQSSLFWHSQSWVPRKPRGGGSPVSPPWVPFSPAQGPIFQAATLPQKARHPVLLRSLCGLDFLLPAVNLSLDMGPVFVGCIGVILGLPPGSVFYHPPKHSRSTSWLLHMTFTPFLAPQDSGMLSLPGKGIWTQGSTCHEPATLPFHPLRSPGAEGKGPNLGSE